MLSFVPISAQFGTPYITSWQLTGAAPEPGSLLVAGMFGLTWAMRKRTRAPLRSEC
jgi:hypothetical protein